MEAKIKETSLNKILQEEVEKAGQTIISRILIQIVNWEICFRCQTFHKERCQVILSFLNKC